ncbi:hypothetical protein ACFL6J_21875, partial [Providencia stuartii]
RFTAEFGMGSGGTTALLPPDKFGFVPVRVDTANQNCNLEQANFSHHSISCASTIVSSSL